MMNIQELQTLAQLDLPVLVIVVNNRGYASIRQSQRNFFGRLAGCDPEHDISFPDFVGVAEASGLDGLRISGPDFVEQLDSLLLRRGPVLVDALLDEEQGYEPRITSTRLPSGEFVSNEPDNMFPFLPAEELSDLQFPAMSGPEPQREGATRPGDAAE